MAECRGCGETVSADYARVFGDSDDVLRRCRHCTPIPEMLRGAGADPVGALEQRTGAPNQHPEKRAVTPWDAVAADTAGAPSDGRPAPSD